MLISANYVQKLYKAANKVQVKIQENPVKVSDEKANELLKINQILEDFTWLVSKL